MKDQLRNVQQIQATSCAFAAILATGHVVTWGNAVSGGYSNHVQDQLRLGSVLVFFWGVDVNVLNHLRAFFLSLAQLVYCFLMSMPSWSQETTSSSTFGKSISRFWSFYSDGSQGNWIICFHKLSTSML